ncbi:phenylacetate--CoA ligase family protein [Streptomyces sp. NBC_00059]|uniref:phenylacetate--CoA ligase family protein n=1 Tax=Streptomyces sp. NBC_00059 TaxID=2975635 RepID=UPI00225513AB|nr:AMP-binding protein [Streptomyces sp. NBC_00059]MCX5415803.1 AMP-binding protein [Streptomyces sp. NBC_00059]
MFTLFDEHLDAFARQTVADHRSFSAGDWNAERTARHQTEALRRTLRYVRDHSPFYAKRLAEFDTDRIDHLTPEDLPDVPFTTKDDLREHTFDLLSRPVHDAWIFYETTGTTGPSTPCPRDNVDSLVNNTALTFCYDEVFRSHGDDHVVAVMGPTELHSTGDTFGDVCRNLGRAVVKMWPHSPVVGFGRALEVLRELRVTAVFCTPGMALSLAKEATAAGLDPARDFSIRFFMLTGELTTPGLLRRIGDVWGAKAHNCLYASQEASVLGAVEADGRLRTVPLNVLYEVVDPVTGRPVPKTSGTRQGELVVTHLYQGSKPLVRYRTGDLVRLTDPAPEDRYPSPTLLPLGRVRDRIELGGELVSAYELEETVLAQATGCADYALTIDTDEDGTDVLTVALEPAHGHAAADAVDERIRQAVQERWRCRARVVHERLGAITTTGAMVSWKAARLHDLRQEANGERRAAMALARHRESR